MCLSFHRRQIRTGKSGKTWPLTALGHVRPAAEAATSGATLISWAPAPEPTHQGILHGPGDAAQVAQLPRRPTCEG